MKIDLAMALKNVASIAISHINYHPTCTPMYMSHNELKPPRWSFTLPIHLYDAQCTKKFQIILTLPTHTYVAQCTQTSHIKYNPTCPHISMLHNVPKPPRLSVPLPVYICCIMY